MQPAGKVRWCFSYTVLSPGTQTIQEFSIPAAAMDGSQALNLLNSQLETTHHYTCRPSPHKNMNLKPNTHSGGVYLKKEIENCRTMLGNSTEAQNRVEPGNKLA
jgi:hypothetical protein